METQWDRIYVLKQAIWLKTLMVMGMAMAISL